MATRRTEPLWLSRVVIDAIHDEQIREHGGLSGVRDENALESALARPRQKWRYATAPDIALAAAAYAFELARNHPYHDGNKRVGFLAAVTFLEINHLSFGATDVEVVTTVVALADGRLSERRLADWLRAHTATTG